MNEVGTKAMAIAETSLAQGQIDLSVIVPVFNEEGTLLELNRQLQDTLKKTGKVFEIILVDDASTDSSFKLLRQLNEDYKGTVRVLTFSRNFGHQLAITAGLNYCRGKAAVVMDADLQDPPEMIQKFLDRWEQGYEIVYGLRKEREGESFFKKWTAKLFYKLIRAATAIDIPENVGDFYLLDRKVINILNSLGERHRFMRGLVAWVGFKRFGVEYVRHARYSGKTKYGFWKMVQFSIDAMTSFSFMPLRFVSWLGAFFSVMSFFAILLIVYMRLFTDATIIGWSSTMAVILFIGGIQLLGIGIIGEYIARIGDDVKNRPLYTVSQFLD